MFTWIEGSELGVARSREGDETCLRGAVLHMRVVRALFSDRSFPGEVVASWRQGVMAHLHKPIFL
jgi:hypothetical protein